MPHPALPDLLASLETGAIDTEYLELASKGRKADWSEVAHDDISCILQRPLDVVPRGVCTGPSGLDSRGSQEAAVQVNIIGESGGNTGDRDKKLEDPCVIIGGPSGLESMPVYTREELTIVCDALVEPLAKAIHGLADVGNLFAGSAPVVEKFSLGGLLRDICSKVVPLTAVLEARQRTIDKIREDHRELYQQSQTLRSNAEHSRDHTSASE